MVLNMKTLKAILHPLTQVLRKSRRIAQAVKVKLVEHKLVGPYIGDQLDEIIRRWSPEKAIIISAPTGSGKTTFVLQKIVRRALFTLENVLIITNRNPLNVAYKTSIAKMTGLFGNYTPEGLKATSQFKNIYIINYQGLESFLSKHKHINFTFVVMDECHYFTQDAPFSGDTEYAMRTIPKVFADAIRIYISATIDGVLPYILLNELPAFYVDDWGILHHAQSHVEAMYNMTKELSPGCNGFRPREIYDSLPEVFTMDADYSRVSLCFYTNLAKVLVHLKENQRKSLIFCNSIKDCKDIAEYEKDTLVIYAERLQKEPLLLKELVTKQKFENVWMATTSVFSNGNNIKDPSVKDVVIELLDPTEIMQMAGRRRISPDIPCDGFTLYLKIPSLDDLLNAHADCKRKLAQFNRYAYDQTSLLYVNNDPSQNPFIHSICRVNPVEHKYELNLMTHDKYYENMRYFEFLIALISEEGEEAYCQHVASMFGKTFDTSMLFMTHKVCVEVLKTFIESFNFPMGINDFDDFCVKFRDKRIELFGRDSADSTDSSRKAPSYVSINRRLEDLGIKYKIVKNDDSFILELL